MHTEGLDTPEDVQETRKMQRGRETLPEKYGYICANCNKRYGKPQPGFWVDIVRCDTCPKLLVH